MGNRNQTSMHTTRRLLVTALSLVIAVGTMVLAAPPGVSRAAGVGGAVRAAPAPTGTFQVTAQFAGVDPTDPILAPVTVDIDWTAPDGTTGTIVVTQANDWTAGPTDDSGTTITFPLGTAITLHETGVNNAPAGQFVTPTAWDPVDPDDSTSGLVTISSESEAAAATIVNGADFVAGTFAVRKALSEDSDFSLDDTDLADASFVVRAAWQDQPNGQRHGHAVLLLNKNNGWRTALGQSLKIGTVVTLTESEMTGAPPDVGWDGSPTWFGGNARSNSDGTATLTISQSDSSRRSC